MVVPGPSGGAWPERWHPIQVVASDPSSGGVYAVLGVLPTTVEDEIHHPGQGTPLPTGGPHHPVLARVVHRHVSGCGLSTASPGPLQEALGLCERPSHAEIP